MVGLVVFSPLTTTGGIAPPPLLGELWPVLFLFLLPSKSPDPKSLARLSRADLILEKMPDNAAATAKPIGPAI